MTGDDRKAVVRRYYEEIWNRNQITLVDELMTTDYRNIDPATPGTVLEGRDAFKALVATYRGVFPDLHFAIDRQIAEGDTVVSTWVASGTMRGAMMGHAPTGRSGSVVGTTVSRFAGEQIAEDWVVWDLFGLVTQLGLAPEPAIA